MARRVVAVDTETTGFQIYDRVISLAAVAHEEGTERLDFLYLCFDPGRNSHPRATEVHGWDDWTTRFQDHFSAHAVNISAWIGDADVLIAHNAEFDF